RPGSAVGSHFFAATGKTDRLLLRSSISYSSVTPLSMTSARVDSSFSCHLFGMRLKVLQALKSSWLANNILARAGLQSTILPVRSVSTILNATELKRD